MQKNVAEKYYNRWKPKKRSDEAPRNKVLHTSNFIYARKKEEKSGVQTNARWRGNLEVGEEQMTLCDNFGTIRKCECGWTQERIGDHYRGPMDDDGSLMMESVRETKMDGCRALIVTRWMISEKSWIERIVQVCISLFFFIYLGGGVSKCTLFFCFRVYTCGDCRNYRPAGQFCLNLDFEVCKVGCHVLMVSWGDERWTSHIRSSSRFWHEGVARRR